MGKTKYDLRLILVIATTLFALLALLAGPTADKASAVPAPRLLKKLVVSKERSSGYDRGKFKTWIDANGNSCDTRDEVLYRQNRARRKYCGDDMGRWVSAYDGVHFRDSSSLDVDHMVPLAEAWRSGAARV